ncbi:methyltransferase [Glaciecola siphonariae]|uniref:Ribosomal RNA small subunit methyltransferase C n=1 Tax=Glaciecola siphonariae TaxID=521012 RepID=A0ABV9LXR3_9ALTE
MLSLPSQLLIRNKALFESGRWALVNPSDTAIFSELQGDIIGLHQQFDSFKALHKIAPEKHVFSAAFDILQVTEAFDGIVVYMPKAKQHLDMLLANMAHLIKPNGLLMVVGENKGGIKSVPKQLERIGVHVNKLDSAKHCGLIACTVESPLLSFDINSYGVERSYQVNHKTLKVFSLPGVFGHKQFDPGTQLLLQQFADPENLRKMRGKLYDFACGTGIIGSYFKMANTKLKVTMSDISALAIYCSKQTLLLNELEAEVIASDGMQELHSHFEHIVSNPPFHDGLKNEYGITQSFIKDAYAKSNRGSRLTIVANRFLPYPEHIEKTFFKFTTLCKTNKFCVYEGLK